MARWKELDIRPGDQVEIALAGLTIPRLQSVAWRTQVRAEVAIPDQQIHDPLSCWLVAPGCEDQFRARLVWLGGKRGLHLDGIGADTWQALIDAGLVHDLLDWMDLTSVQLAKVPNLGQARAAAVAQTFADARKRPFADWLRAMGMPPTASMALPDFTQLSVRSAEDWQTAGAGNTKSKHLAAFFAHPDVRAHAARLHAIGVQGF